GAGGGWTHSDGVGGVAIEAVGERFAERDREFPRGSAGARIAERTEATGDLYDGEQPSAAAQGCGARARYGGVRGAPAHVSGAGLQVRGAGPQYDPRSGGSGGAERGADAFGRDARLMIVMKFGGTSVESASAIERVAGIVKAREKQRPVVVVSAMGKTTNKLLAIASAAVAGN